MFLNHKNRALGAGGRRFESCHPDKKGIKRYQKIANYMIFNDFHFY